MITGRMNRKVQIKDYTARHYIPEDEQDFEVRTIYDERLIDSIPGLDDEFERDMYNLGNADDLPNSDRIMDCQTRGIDKRTCFGKDRKPEIIID